MDDVSENSSGVLFSAMLDKIQEVLIFFPLSKMKNAVLTFDDASRSHFEFAVPLLKQHGFGIRFARTTQSGGCGIGSPLPWGSRSGTPPRHHDRGVVQNSHEIFDRQ